MAIDPVQKEQIKKPSILVIDDHANVSKLVEAYLFKAGFSQISIQHADSLEIASLIIENNKPDLVLLDNLLPPHFDFRQSVRDLSKIFLGPIVLFSGEIPANIGEEEIDHLLTATISKDDISDRKFIETIQKLLYL